MTLGASSARLALCHDRRAGMDAALPRETT